MQKSANFPHHFRFPTIFTHKFIFPANFYPKIYISRQFSTKFFYFPPIYTQNFKFPAIFFCQLFVFLFQALFSPRHPAASEGSVCFCHAPSSGSTLPWPALSAGSATPGCPGGKKGEFTQGLATSRHCHEIFTSFLLVRRHRTGLCICAKKTSLCEKCLAA